MNEQKTKNGILEGVIWKQLLLFFFPIMIGSFFQQLYNTVDALVLGRAVGKEALAAVGGSAALITGLIINFFMGLTSGAGIIASQMLGAGKKEELNKAVHTIYAFSIMGSIFFAIVGIVVSPALLELMNTAPELMEDSVLYLRIYFGGIIFVFLYNTGSGILRALGDSKRPLYYLMVCCVLNVVLDLVMVMGFRLGVAGVAIATVIAQAVSTVLVTQALIREKDLCRFSLREMRIDFHMLKSELFLGLPSGIQFSMYNISNMIVQSAINSFGTNTTAAWAAYGKLDAIYWMISGALGISITTFVGQNYGAGKMDRVKKSVRICLWMDIVVSVVMAALLIAARKPLFGIFCSDAAVIETGAKMLVVIAPFYFLFAFTEIYSGALRGMGDVIVPMLITTVGVCAIRVFWIAVIAGMYPTMEVVIFNYPVTWILSAVLFFVYYLYRTKKLKCTFKNIAALGIFAILLSGCGTVVVDRNDSEFGTESVAVTEQTIEDDITENTELIVETEPEPEITGAYDFTICFAGDISLDENAVTTAKLDASDGDIATCISPELLDIMRNADLMCLNNEFTYSTNGSPMEGKMYTFRANPKRVSVLQEMGVDLVTLANNHVYDYGKQALLDTFDILEGAGITYFGAGRNLEEAMAPLYVTLDDKTVAFVGASRAEKNKMTPQATETEPGILRCYDTELFLECIREADANADFVIAMVHWGTEYSYDLEKVQLSTGKEYLDAGADVIIGAHSHCLQGMEYYDGKPIVYSLGNYWFNDKTLDSMLVELHFSGNDNEDCLEVKMIPAIQTNATTNWVDESEKQRIYEFMESISINIEIDEDGIVREKAGLQETEE